jgi:hypothetical protein
MNILVMKMMPGIGPYKQQCRNGKYDDDDPIQDGEPFIFPNEFDNEKDPHGRKK